MKLVGTGESTLSDALGLPFDTVLRGQCSTRGQMQGTRVQSTHSSPLSHPPLPLHKESCFFPSPNSYFSILDKHILTLL